MMVEIQKLPNKGKSILVSVNGTGSTFQTAEAAYVHLRGKVAELQAAVDTAINMYEIQKESEK